MVHLLDYRLGRDLAWHRDGAGPRRAHVVQRALLLVSILTLGHPLFVYEDVLVLLIHGTASVLVLRLIVTILHVFGCYCILCVARRRHIARQLQLARCHRLLLLLASEDVLRWVVLRLGCLADY